MFEPALGHASGRGYLFPGALARLGIRGVRARRCSDSERILGPGHGTVWTVSHFPGFLNRYGGSMAPPFVWVETGDCSFSGTP